MQNYHKVVAKRFLSRIAGLLHRAERKYRRFFLFVFFMDANHLTLVYVTVSLLKFILDNTRNNR